MDRNDHLGGDELLERFLDAPDDAAANELLSAFFAGYPVERLRVLLRSDNEEAVRAGAWIASELSESAAPLMDDLSRLLDHPAKYVRFFVIDAVLGSASCEHGATVARAVMRIRDGDQAVRWMTLHLLSKASKDQLVASLPFLGEQGLAEHVQWLLAAGENIDEVCARLSVGDEVAQMFAAAAAARLSGKDQAGLQHAAASSHPEVRSFAREELEGLSQRG